MSRRLLALAVFPALIFAACARPTNIVCRDEAVDKKGEFKWSQKQADVACERAVLTLAASKNKETGVWELRRDIISVEEMRKLLSDRAKALDMMQWYDDEWWAGFVDWVRGMREALSREEQATLWLLQRIQFAETYNEFTALVGELPKEMVDKNAEYFFEHGSKNYSIRMLYPGRDITSIAFTARYVEEAKKDGKLKLVDSFMVTDKQKYGEKIQDLQDSNKFSWDYRERGWVILSYKITADSDAPADNVVHYVEVFRMDPGSLIREENPSVRGFLAAGGNNVSIFVIDYDKKDEPGFGSPDAVKKISQDITTGRDLYNNESLRKDLLAALYERPKSDKTRPERRKPSEKPVYVEIVPMGQKIDVDVWEKKAEGWRTPFDYQTLSVNLELAFGGPSGKAELELKEKHSDLKRINLFVKQFKRSWEIVAVEYWLPKEEYSKFNVTHASAGTGMHGVYTVQRKGQTREEAEIEYFASRIKAIDYLYGGVWFRIVDEDGDGVFEKRRQIADPTKSVNNNNSSVGRYHGSSNP